MPCLVRLPFIFFLNGTIDSAISFRTLWTILWLAKTSNKPISLTTWLAVDPNLVILSTALAFPLRAVESLLQAACSIHLVQMSCSNTFDAAKQKLKLSEMMDAKELTDSPLSLAVASLRHPWTTHGHAEILQLKPYS